MTPLMAQSWLVGWLFVLGLSLGSLWLILVFQLTGGDWGNRMMPRAAAAARSIVVVALLGVPLLFWMPDLFPWAQTSQVAASRLLQHRQTLYNVPFVQLRWGISMLGTALLAFAVSRPGPLGGLRRCPGLAGGGGILLMALHTALALDWVQSLEPHFYSTIMGVLVIMANILAALALLVWLCLGEAGADVSGKDQAGGVKPGQRCHDWGSLLLAMVMMVAYMLFSQLVVVWSGNIPDEVGWLTSRVWGDWKPLAIFLFLTYLAVPFLFLLNGAWKRKPRVLRPMAAWLFFASIMYHYFLLWPSLSPDRMVFQPLAFLAVLVALLPWALSYRFFLRGRLP